MTNPQIVYLVTKDLGDSQWQIGCYASETIANAAIDAYMVRTGDDGPRDNYDIQALVVRDRVSLLSED